MKAKVNKVTIEIIQGDIFALEVDGIIISSTPSLTLPQEILDYVGEGVQSEATQIGTCDVGSAVVTSAGNISHANKLIHTVGPRWGEGSERGKLSNAAWRALLLAEETELKSIAIPPISVGALGYPVEGAARAILEKVIDVTFETLKHLRHITICVSTQVAFEAFVEEFKRQLENLKESGEGKVRV